MVEAARRHGGFDVQAIDLAELNLPVFNEANYPMMRQYEHDHTLEWASIVGKLDAVVFVTPEYNHGPPPSIVNALTYLTHEWAYLPVGFVGYGGLPAAARAIQMLRQYVSALRMVAVPESVLFSNAMQLLNDQGVLVASTVSDQSADLMLDELMRWTIALTDLRAGTRGA
jgi:NAD(P)H-dependent FMN reductase